MRIAHGAVVLLLSWGLPTIVQSGTYKTWMEVESELVSEKMLHQQIPMRDGIKLDANIYLPVTPAPAADELVRSPQRPGSR